MAARYILSVNAGSSSLKCRLFKSAGPESESEPEQVAKAKVDGLNQPSGPSFDFDPPVDGRPDGQGISSHQDAFVVVMDVLKAQQRLPREAELTVAHRVVHGGQYEAPIHISEEVLHELERLEGLAPLHNAPAVAIIRKCLTTPPSRTAKNVAFFDTAFHTSIPEHVRTYAIDPAKARERGLRKYGFHGISYGYILRRMAEALGRSAEDLNLIMMHLGSGASVCAVRGGKSIDTSMGLTPGSGLPGATRSGDVDPSLIFHFMSSASRETESGSTSGVSITEAELVLNKRSGWKCLTGTSDFAEIAAAAAAAAAPGATDRDRRFQLAFDIFVDRIVSFVGAYFVKLGGRVDGLVFSGGIGESSAQLRAAVVDKLACLDYVLHKRRNEGDGEEEEEEKEGGSETLAGMGVRRISENGRAGVFVCWTDEEGEMARGVMKLGK